MARHRKRRTQDLIGPVHKSADYGGEAVHYCLSCNKPKLWWNQSTGLFHCFHCNIAGRATCFSDAVIPTKVTVLSGSEQAVHERIEHKLLEIAIATDAKLRRILEHRRISFAIVERVTEQFSLLPTLNGFAFPLRGVGGFVGFQSYVPGRLPKYKTEGNRGISGKVFTTTSGDLVVTEGIFDAFQIYTLGIASVAVCCAAGNSLTTDQVDTLLLYSRDDSHIYLAFDNDKLSAACKAYSLLTPYREMVLVTPPTSLGKDWDDAIKKDRTWCSDYWRRLTQ